MRPAQFELLRPSTITEAVAYIGAGAVPLAGGQSMLQAMRLREQAPSQVVDLGGVEALSERIELTDDTLVIGARVTHQRLLSDPQIQAEFPWLAAAAAAVGDVQVRNLGTVVGNVCWADPRANLAVALLACDAVANVEHASGTQHVPLANFFRGYRQTNHSDGLVSAIELPRPGLTDGKPSSVGVYLEFSRQRQDLALINTCVVVNKTYCRIAVGGIDPTPVRLLSVEAQVNQSSGHQRELTAALFTEDRHPPSDPYGERSYKLGLAKTLVNRAIEQLTGELSE